MEKREFQKHKIMVYLLHFTMLLEVFKASVQSDLLYLKYFKWTFQNQSVVSSLSVHLSFLCRTEPKVVMLNAVGEHIEHIAWEQGLFSLGKGGQRHIWETPSCVRRLNKTWGSSRQSCSDPQTSWSVFFFHFLPSGQTPNPIH